MTLIEKVARAICLEACSPPGDAEQAHTRDNCRHCEAEPDCTMWTTFEREARAAISAVRKSDRGK